MRVIALRLLGDSQQQAERTKFIDRLLDDFMQTAITDSEQPKEFFDSLVAIVVRVRTTCL